MGPQGLLQAALICNCLVFPGVAWDLPFEYHPQIDVFNQHAAVAYFDEKFHKNDRKYLTDSELLEASKLRDRAFQDPVLAFGAAQVLYMFAWFSSDGKLLRSNAIAAAQLYELSIAASNCHPDHPAWFEWACDIRWMHGALLYSWLSKTDEDQTVAMRHQAKAEALLLGLTSCPRYANGASTSWTRPEHINFNSIKFPHAPSRPIWRTEELPIGPWLEYAYPTFKSELEGILADPRDLYTLFQKLDPSPEHLATPGGWETVRIVRYGNWFQEFCLTAPKTCKLLKSRPELTNCQFMNVNYAKLNPGAELKPHYGNGPRLSAHLPVLAPEPQAAGMNIGGQDVTWTEGKAILFDDTYPHYVRHWGQQPRYVLLLWFCHPCDVANDHGQVCPTK